MLDRIICRLKDPISYEELRARLSLTDFIYCHKQLQGFGYTMQIGRGSVYLIAFRIYKKPTANDAIRTFMINPSHWPNGLSLIKDLALLLTRQDFENAILQLTELASDHYDTPYLDIQTALDVKGKTKRCKFSRSSKATGTKIGSDTQFYDKEDEITQKINNIKSSAYYDAQGEKLLNGDLQLIEDNIKKYYLDQLSPYKFWSRAERKLEGSQKLYKDTALFEGASKTDTQQIYTLDKDKSKHPPYGYHNRLSLADLINICCSERGRLWLSSNLDDIKLYQISFTDPATLYSLMKTRNLPLGKITTLLHRCGKIQESIKLVGLNETKRLNNKNRNFFRNTRDFFTAKELPTEQQPSSIFMKSIEAYFEGCKELLTTTKFTEPQSEIVIRKRADALSNTIDGLLTTLRATDRDDVGELKDQVTSIANNKSYDSIALIKQLSGLIKRNKLIGTQTQSMEITE